MTGRIDDRQGATLLELMIAVLVSTLVLSAALGFLKQQTQALALGTSQMRVVQNSRFALSLLRRELRTAGSYVHPAQATLVYASEDALVINADYAGNAPDDAFAIYVDTTMPDVEVGAMPQGLRTELIPRSGMLYPDTTFSETNGMRSRAETLTFYFAQDSTTPRTDDYALYRRVNGQPRAVVARNILRNGTLPFFEFVRLRTHPDSAPRMLPIPRTSLPLRHTVIHGSARDTGRSSVTDSVRAVRVSLISTNGRVGSAEVKRASQQTIRLVNAGVAVLEACGETPVLGGIAMTAVGSLTPAPELKPRVQLTWQQASDERAGERDILRYVVWRMAPGATEWGEPYLSIPAGQASYTYVDETVERGRTYRYAIAAQDCTPSMSALAQTTAAVP
ncbi:MAG TPA: hypothetical protein VF625_06680 [Longimicrobium sp.]|jgi:type II secretory pathway pseudopilin PulG